MTSNCSYSAIGHTDSLCSISPLVSLLPRLLLLTALFAHSGPHAMLRLAVRRHLPTTERAHFSQYKSAKTLYDAVVARYSSPATAALSRPMLPYLFPDLAAFPTVADLITHLRTSSDTRYRAALPVEFCAKNPPPPMYITLYYIVTRLPDSLCLVRDHFLSVCPTTLTVDLLEERLLAIEKSIVPVGASRVGRPARARGARALEGLAGAVEVVVEAVEGVGVVVGVVAGVELSVAAVEAEEAAVVVEGAEAAEVAEAAEAAVELVTALHRGVGPVHGGETGPCTYVLRTGDRAGEQCGGPHSTQRYFGRLTDAWRHQFLQASEIPRKDVLSRAGVAIFDLDYDAILAAMYVVSTSDEGDCYLCVPPGPGIETVALGAGEAAALGASASGAPGAGEFALSGTTSAQALHTFTLDSGASRSFFRDRTTLTPLSQPVAVSLADPSRGPVLASFSTVLPCPAAPSGTLSGVPRSLPPLPPRPATTCVPCVEGRQRAAPHSSELPLTEAPLQTLHMDVWGPARVCAHQLNLQPRVSLPETSHTLRWTGKVGDASAFRVWGSRAFVRDLSADKLSPRAVPCVFLGFPLDAPGWQFYHPTSCRVLSS
ncbi:unnamed protein product [Closterium sp. NIES-65]|nr:unnamed protein product [Closterium sp. NIES-65]